MTLTVALLVNNLSIFPVIVVLFFVSWFLTTNIRIVPQANAYVIERLGAYSKTWTTGLHLKVPFIERVAKRVSLKEQVADFEPQAVITKDNVTMQIDTVVFYQITDPVLYAYGIDGPITAIENLSATTLRNIIGDLELDQTLTSRDVINTRLRTVLDEATDPWGIKVNRVELKNILPPREIQTAMEKQMKAEREKREAILLAEGQRESLILQAEGHKQSQILQAEADKEARIRKAEGEAEAILKVAEAQAAGLKALKSAQADTSVLTLKAYDALAKVADGKATKLIVPSNLQGLVGLAATLKESFEQTSDSAK
ncbi:SPFH domain-containing protein [Amygdalobacter nucleatus]|uniref:SPFH domain-containing protein n=1 Tax=Amygdalobacter nucleatus TaxID=3029274 RepID=UPI00279DBBA1|nr:SPFH domain-containing protein [Amygdalobacter nucleatus]WEG37284.1 SPFH/Band 7/PHB domain protein [Amygdalobacter nucleatus]